MIQPGRKYETTNSYRYGFNGKENDNDVKGVEGSQQDYGFRIYDPRLGKFFSMDPLSDNYPWFTPYQFAGNMPIRAVDLDGAELLLSFLPNPFSKENTATLKNNLGISDGSKMGNAVDFVAGAGDRYRDLNNPLTYIKSAGTHLGNMWNNAKGIVIADNPQEAWRSALYLGLPSLNSAEQTGYQAKQAIQTGDYRTMGGLAVDLTFAIFTDLISGPKSLPGPLRFRGKITGEKGVVWAKARAAAAGDVAAAAELRVAKKLREKGSDVHFMDADKGNAAGTGTYDFTVNGIKTDVKRIDGLGRNAVSDVAKGVEQVGPGGQVIVVRPATSKFTLQQYENSLIKNFKPKQPNVTIKVVDESSLPTLSGN